MSWSSRLRRTFSRRTDNDISDEVQFHLDSLANEYTQQGMTPDAAKQAAFRRFGSVAATHERAREQITLRWIGDVFEDIRLALRLIRRQRGFSLTFVGTVALGVGATTAVFGLVYSVLLRPLPYRSPSELVAIWGTPAADASAKLTVSFDEYQRWRQQTHALSSLAAVSWFRGDTILSGVDTPRALLGVDVTVDFFPMLGVAAALGRTFDDADLSTTCVTVLAHRFWQQLGGDVRVIGHVLRLNDHACTVVGVMPASFVFFPEPTAFWTLITPDSDLARDPDAHVAIIGRLAPRTTVASALAELRSLALTSTSQQQAQLPRLLPAGNTLQQEFTWLAGRNLQRTLLVLFAAVGCLLLIACINVSNLVLGRSLVRMREVAIRAALGATRGRILRQLAVEHLMLSVIGAAAGTAVAYISLTYLRVLQPVQLPPGTDLTATLPLMAFAGFVGSLAGVLFGMVPARRISRVNLQEVIATGSRGIASPGRQRATRLLIVLQATLSLLLLVCAGLLTQSVTRFASTPLAFEPKGAYSLALSPPRAAYRNPASRSQLYLRLIDALATEPGGPDTAFSSTLPPRGGPVAILEREGAAPASPERSVFDTQQQVVSGSYFNVMRIPLRSGRTFNAGDQLGARPVGIVNGTLARKYFGTADPIGQQIRLALPPPGNTWITIIGVAADEERIDVRQELGWVMPPILYLPIGQRPIPALQLIVRPQTRLNNDALQGILRRIEPGLILGVPQRLDDVIAEYFRYPDFRAVLLTGFAVVALLLAGVGLYAILAQTVVQRTREIGIRIALGASRRSVVAATLKDGLVLTTTGIVAGLGLVVPLRATLAGMLYGIGPTDAVTLVGVSTILLVVGFCASSIPAFRTSRVDPSVCLRQE